MTELESLDLSMNKLDGEIPSELTRLTFLAKLNLPVNNLVGQIPRSNQFSTFENDSYMGNLGLCGLPLTRKCKEDDGKLMQPAEEEDDEYEFIDGFGWRSVVMGYGSGFVVGIGIGYMIIRSGRPTWLVEFFFGVGYKYKTKKRHNIATPTRIEDQRDNCVLFLCLIWNHCLSCVDFLSYFIFSTLLIKQHCIKSCAKSEMLHLKWNEGSIYQSHMLGNIHITTQKCDQLLTHS